MDLTDAMLQNLHNTEAKFLHPRDAENPNERGTRQQEAAQQASNSKKGKKFAKQRYEVSS